MAGSLNKTTLIGHLGKNPEIRTMQNGGKVARLLARHVGQLEGQAVGRAQGTHRVA